MTAEQILYALLATYLLGLVLVAAGKYRMSRGQLPAEAVVGEFIVYAVRVCVVALLLILALRKWFA